jgi:hypothetical protein
MADDHNDSQRNRDDAARRAEGFAPALPGDAYATYALAELARRMGWGDSLITDAVTDTVAEEYLGGFDEIDREMAWEDLDTVKQESDEALIARVARAIARSRAEDAKRAAVTA